MTRKPYQRKTGPKPVYKVLSNMALPEPLPKDKRKNPNQERDNKIFLAMESDDNNKTKNARANFIANSIKPKTIRGDTMGVDQILRVYYRHLKINKNNR